MNARTARLWAVLAVASTLGLTSALAHATAPGKNGRIAFERYRRSDKPLWSEIWVINPDGTGQHTRRQPLRDLVGEAGRQRREDAEPFLLRRRLHSQLLP